MAVVGCISRTVISCQSTLHPDLLSLSVSLLRPDEAFIIHQYGAGKTDVLCKYGPVPHLKVRTVQTIPIFNTKYLCVFPSYLPGAAREMSNNFLGGETFPSLAAFERVSIVSS